MASYSQPVNPLAQISLQNQQAQMQFLAQVAARRNEMVMQQRQIQAQQAAQRRAQVHDQIMNSLRIQQQKQYLNQQVEAQTKRDLQIHEWDLEEHQISRDEAEFDRIKEATGMSPLEVEQWRYQNPGPWQQGQSSGAPMADAYGLMYPSFSEAEQTLTQQKQQREQAQKLESYKQQILAGETTRWEFQQKKTAESWKQTHEALAAQLEDPAIQQNPQAVQQIQRMMAENDAKIGKLKFVPQPTKEQQWEQDVMMQGGVPVQKDPQTGEWKAIRGWPTKGTNGGTFGSESNMPPEFEMEDEMARQLAFASMMADPYGSRKKDANGTWVPKTIADVTADDIEAIKNKHAFNYIGRLTHGQKIKALVDSGFSQNNAEIEVLNSEENAATKYRINKALREGARRQKAGEARAVRGEPPPGESSAPAPLPENPDDLQVGKVYLTQWGPRIWTGQGFKRAG